MKLQDKINKLIPYIWEKFIELDYKYDYWIKIRFWFFLPHNFTVSSEFSDWIKIEMQKPRCSIDFNKVVDPIFSYSNLLNRLPQKQDKWTDLFVFICESRKDEDWHKLKDDIDFLLDKTIEFVEFLVEKYKKD